MLLICVWYCVSFLSHLEQPCHFCVLLPHSYLFAQTEPEPITPEVALVQSAGHNTYAEGQVSCEDLAVRHEDLQPRGFQSKNNFDNLEDS